VVHEKGLWGAFAVKRDSKDVRRVAPGGLDSAAAVYTKGAKGVGLEVGGVS